ncbi:hypothetical protein Tco_0826986, partial [Tanacetum coccineum]
HAFWGLNEEISRYCSDNLYAVSIKEDTAYQCLHFTRNHEELKSNMSYPEDSIRRIKDYLKILKDIERDPYSKKPPMRHIDLNQYGCMTKSSNKKLIQPFENPEQVFRSSRKLSKTRSLDYLNSPEFNLIYDPEDQAKIEDKDHFELKVQFLKELHDNTFSGSDNEDANEHIEKVLEIFDLFHIPNITQDQVMLRDFLMSLIREVILFYKGLEVPTRQILDSKGAIPSMKAAEAKKAIQEMTDHSQKWHNETSTRCRSTETSDGLAAIQAQLNNHGREIKKVNEKVYVAQVGCELCKGPHYTKDFPLKEEGKTLEEAYYTQFGVPFPQGGQYRAAAPGFYQRNNGNPSYQERRQTMEESLRKFMAESAKRHEENSNLIKEIRASTDAAIRN